MYTFVSSFVLIYLTDTVGLEAGIIGTLMLVVSMLRGLGMSPMLGTMNAVIAETSEYTFKKDKVRLDGTMFSCSSMGIKLGGGIGTALCGWLLTLGGYVGGAIVRYRPLLGEMLGLWQSRFFSTVWKTNNSIDITCIYSIKYMYYILGGFCSE